MNILLKFSTEYFWLLVFLSVIILSLIIYLKSKDERLKKTEKVVTELSFSKKEYTRFKECGDKVLNNTTISFAADNMDANVDKMEMYYFTVSVGNCILESIFDSFSIADVGEI